ncbi:MAG: ribosome biogenesis GTPase YlqF [Firmicutes bacterium]|nr:ribosome biogenesis GTPase YlqF [Bacillota bacterium]
MSGVEAIRRVLREMDMVIEVLDARAPMSTSSPRIAEVAGGREIILVLNKIDLADPVKTRMWKGFFEGQGAVCVPLNARTGLGVSDLIRHAEALASSIAHKLEARHRRRRAIRAVVIGFPNVGKSSLVNRVAGRKRARTGNRPGITRGRQWIVAGKGLELLDTPGIMKIIDEDDAGIRDYAWPWLCAIGCVPDEGFDPEPVASRLLSLLSASAPGTLESRYGIQIDSRDGTSCEGIDEPDILHSIARARGCLGPGGVPDISRAARLAIRDFREGKLGRVTLESPSSQGHDA